MNFENTNNEPEVYSEEQLAKWSEGAIRYQSFYDGLSEEDKSRNSRLIEELKLLFLGEKPAYFSGNTMNLFDKEGFDYLLEEAGFEMNEEFIYDPKQVADVIEKYSNVFAKYRLNKPEDVINYLVEAEKKEANDIRGLILGFPYEAVKNFDRIYEADSYCNELIAKLEKILKNNDDKEYLNYKNKNSDNKQLLEFLESQLEKYQIELGLSDNDLKKAKESFKISLSKRDFNAGGIYYWMDLDDSKESIDREKKLKDALKKSGILSL